MVNEIHDLKEELRFVRERIANINKYGLAPGEDIMELYTQEEEILGILWHFGVPQN